MVVVILPKTRVPVFGRHARRVVFSPFVPFRVHHLLSDVSVKGRPICITTRSLCPGGHRSLARSTLTPFPFFLRALYCYELYSGQSMFKNRNHHYLLELGRSLSFQFYQSSRVRFPPSTKCTIFIVSRSNRPSLWFLTSVLRRSGWSSAKDLGYLND